VAKAVAKAVANAMANAMAKLVEERVPGARKPLVALPKHVYRRSWD